MLQLPTLAGLLDKDPLIFAGLVGDSAQSAGGAPWIDPSAGYEAQALNKLSADLWLAGHVPWWNPYNGAGLPLAAQGQPGSFFLPFVLLYHFRCGGAWVTLLLQIIAGLATYVLLRRIKLVGLAALTGGLLFELNGTFAWLGAPATFPIAFLPMLLLGVERLRAHVIDNRPGGWLLIPLALAWSLYAGFPETAYIDGLLTGLWVLARLSGLDNRQKAQFIQRLCFSVAGGLACSVPLLIPFAEFLTRSYVGGHDGAFAHASLPSASAALSLMPWVFGPIFLYNDPSNIVTATWGSIGGYLPALELALALLGMQRTQGRLRLALMAWMLLCLCKTYDIRPVSDLMNLLPMVGSAAFFRYSPPSWEFAGAALAALAVDGLGRGIPLTRSRATLTFGTALAIVLAALWLARHQIDALIRYGSYYIFLAAALGWLAVSLLTGLAAILLCNRWNHGIHLLTFMLVADACVAFALPIGSGAWNVQRQEPGVAFLREHIGLQRVYTLGPLAPNYGAFFKIAQINHNYLPVSKNWVDYIHQHLDPGAGYTGFIGDAPRKDRKSTAAEQLRERRPAYEELGVKYILAAPGVDPLANALRTKHKGAGYDQVLQLKNDQGIVVHWDVPGVPEQRAIDRITVLTGTYGNQSNGVLIAQVCVDGGHCVKGHRAFAGSVDNAPLAISLDHPLAVPERSDGTSVPLTITLTQHQSTFPAVVWLSALDARANQKLSLDGAPSGVAPTLTLEFNASDTDAISRLAYEGSDMSIHQLLNTKPYFEVIEGACSLHALSRVSAETDCSTPGRLLRREATYPGWRAAIDGKAAPVTEARELFQSVALPTGKHRIVFTYRPTYFGLICAGFAAGLLTLLYGAWRELSYWREGQNERWRQPPEGRDPAASAART